MSFSAITNSEIDASSPVTQALLRKFRDNIESHKHAAGQGAPLVVGSFEDEFVTSALVPDSTVTSDKIAPTIFVKQKLGEASIPSSEDIDVEPQRFIDDRDLIVTFTNTERVIIHALFISHYLTGDTGIDLAIEVNGIRQARTVRMNHGVSISTALGLVVTFAPGSHTITPGYLDTKLESGTTGRIFVESRLFIVRLLGKL